MARLDAMSAKLAALGRDHGLTSEGPSAAVAAILREQPGADGAELFFIRRAEHPQDPWSGHIAFPGGRRDPEDESLLATAIRETREEVGIDLSPTDLMGRLPDLPAFSRSRRGTDLVVVPFVFAVRGDVTIVPNDEVATTLWVPMATLVRGDGRGVFDYAYDGRTYELPCIQLGRVNHTTQTPEGRLDPGAYRLWGMTYRMLETLLDAIR